MSVNFSVRVAGCAAPELKTSGGIAARDALAALLPPNSIVTLDSRRLDKYGRAEARVFDEKNTDIGQLLITNGFCEPADDSGPI